ncbi:hypothetical protein Alches_06790 [Alicyclobacillus hesperidum subsp. aegles]|uniref:YheC/YheD family endospore coat-associated protein n=1 Tax=Alicyclobacillus hesperidum TaxID=89784 RepID=UPI000AA33AAD|nr:YheC/YheD family protein [Alicyclobacillus hesperidum]GLG00640.1 hypothetical protein Alches_06790 [Alicyclobacillus hesperidum subsp. aegles]
MNGKRAQVQIQTFDSSEAVIRTHPSFGCQSTQMECAYGGRKLTVRLVPDARIPVDTLAVSKTAARRLRLAADGWTFYATVSDSQIRLGPLIGILASPRWDKAKQTLRPSGQLEGLRRMVEIAEEQGARCFLFHLTDIDLSKGNVTGYTLVDGKWVRRPFPLPDVIYDQLVSRKIERDPKLQEKRAALSKKYGNKFFNDGFFDKWEVYEWLQDSDVSSHVPETIRHRTWREAIAFVNRHSMTFLKPLHGSLGLGIARFVKARDGSVTYELKQSARSVVRGKGASAAEVLEAFRTRLRRRPYIWQQGLALATYKGRPVDIRILMQRDESGEWKRTKMFARVAKSGDFTSNLTTGGDAMTVDAAFSECLPSAADRRRAKAQIRRLAKEVAAAVEAGSGRTFGELGIDLGIDQQGKAWIIEVNSKPRKAPRSEKGRQDLVDLSFRRPIGYAIYLAQQSS